MKQLINILLVVIIASWKGNAQITLNLDDILKAVVDNSFISKQAKNTQEQTKENYRFFSSQLKPQISFGANFPNYSKTSVPITQPDGTIFFQSIQQTNSTAFLNLSQRIGMTGGTLFAYSDLTRFDDLSSKQTAYNGTPIRIGIFQPIFGFNDLKYDKEIEPLRVVQAEKQFNLDIEQALLNATRLYFDVLIGKQDLEIAKTNQAINAHLLGITNERFELGKVSLDEKLQLEIEFNNAELAYSQAQTRLSTATVALYNLLGQNIPIDSAHYAIPELDEEIVLDDKEISDAYVRNSPIILDYKIDQLEAERAMASAKAEFGVQLNISASVGLTRGAPNVSDVYGDPFDEQTANVSLNIPLVDWGRRKSAVKIQELNKLAVENQYQQLLTELENNISNNVQVLRNMQNELKLLVLIMKKAEERFNISNERYVLGNIDITNLTLAQREKDETKRNYMNALQRFWLSYFELRTLTGYDPIRKSNINYN